MDFIERRFKLVGYTEMRINQWRVERLETIERYLEAHQTWENRIAVNH